MFIGVRWVYSGTAFGIFVLVVFVRTRVIWFICGAPSYSLGSFGRSVGSRVHSGLLGSFGRDRRVDLGSLVHSSAPWGLFDSFGFVGFIGARAGGRQVHSGSLCSLDRAVSVVVCIKVRRVHWTVLLGSSGSVGFSRFRSVQSGAPLWSHSFEFIGLILGCPSVYRNHPGGRRVHSGSLGAVGRALIVIRFIRVHSGGRKGKGGGGREGGREGR